MLLAGYFLTKKHSYDKWAFRCCDYFEFTVYLADTQHNAQLKYTATSQH